MYKVRSEKNSPEREADLVRRLRGRDPNAMGDVYDCFGGIVYATILRVVRDNETAEDLAQETFLRVWNRIAAFDPARGTLLWWITAIARNQAIDYIRSAATVKLVYAADTLEHLAAGSSARSHQPEFADRLAVRDSVKKFEPALASLPENQRAVLSLSFVDGMSHSEIAKALGRPLGTVKTWMRAALQVLRAQADNPKPVVARK